MRGDGIGIELGAHVVRGVRLRADHPERATDFGETPIADGETATLTDALVRLRGMLDAPTSPTRIAWFPTGASLQRLDATGLAGTELNALRHRLATESGVGSTMLIDADARRWMLAIRWDQDRAWRITEVAERAGFIDVEVEPSPVAIRRVLSSDVEVVRRDVEPASSWTAFVEDKIPLAASEVEPGSRAGPSLAAGPSAAGLYRADALLEAEALADEVGRVSALTFGTDATTGGAAPTLIVPGSEYPPFPAHDLRAPERVAVALGAAVGAAGLMGNVRPVDVLGPAAARSPMPRPWAIEAVGDEPPPLAERSEPTRFQQLTAPLRRRRRR